MKTRAGSARVRFAPILPSSGVIDTQPKGAELASVLPLPEREATPPRLPVTGRECVPVPGKPTTRSPQTSRVPLDTGTSINGFPPGTQYDGLNVTTESGLTYGGALSLWFGNASAFGGRDGRRLERFAEDVISTTAAYLPAYIKASRDLPRLSSTRYGGLIDFTRSRALDRLGTRIAVS